MDARDIITKDMTIGDLKKRNYGTFNSNDKKVKITIIKDPDTREYIGKWYENGKYSEAKTNYTDDKEDAIGTAKTAIKHYEKYGN